MAVQYYEATVSCTCTLSSLPPCQVEYLLEHGADVNRGLKSSSLHYAACFGRPNIVKLLLQCGADPDLRDEDGHTPMEKAQERGDEWHRKVIEILENPSKLVYMILC